MSNTFGFGGHNTCVIFKKLNNLNGLLLLKGLAKKIKIIKEFKANIRF